MQSKNDEIKKLHFWRGSTSTFNFRWMQLELSLEFQKNAANTKFDTKLDSTRQAHRSLSSRPPTKAAHTKQWPEQNHPQTEDATILSWADRENAAPKDDWVRIANGRNRRLPRGRGGIASVSLGSMCPSTK